MDAVPSDLPEEIADQELIDRVRSGDASAFGLLWERHAGPARSVARGFTGLDPDDIVSEAFERLLMAIQAGKGPQEAFRPYLIATVRNVARRHYKREAPSTEVDFDLIVDDDALNGERAAIQGQQYRAVGEAFQSLPPRWQEALWYAEVDGLKPRELTGRLGLSANAVSALVLRAKRAFRDAWVSAQLTQATSEECQRTIADIGAYTRDGLAPRATKKVQGHVDTCESCTSALHEAHEISRSLAFVLLPAIAGAAGAIGYVSTIRPPTMPEMQLPTMTAAAAAAAGGPAEKEVARERNTHRSVIAAVLSLVLIAGAIAIGALARHPPAAPPEAIPAATEAQRTDTPPVLDAPLVPAPTLPAAPSNALPRVDEGSPPLSQPVVPLAPASPDTTGELPTAAPSRPPVSVPQAPQVPEVPDAQIIQSDGRMYPRLVGASAVPGALIEIMDRTGAIVAVADADSRGRWAAAVTKGSPGSERVFVAQTVLGLRSDLTAALTYTVDDPPSMSRPLADSTVNAERFNFQLEGPAGTVIQRQIEGHTQIQTLTIPASGVWNEYLAVPAGPHSVRLRYANPETRDFGPWTETAFLAE